MKIIILNGSPRPKGNCVAMIEAFIDGAKENGHRITVVPVGQKKIAGCLGCEYCHTKGDGKCIQQDDMQEIYPMLADADMVIVASPIYYHNMTGQMQCAINRTYAVGVPENLKKCAIFLSSGSPNMYDGALFEYQNTFCRYWNLENMGIFTSYGDQNKSSEKLEEIKAFGQSLK